MTREVQSVLMVLVGGALLRISIGDIYLRYVKEGMKVWLIISGALLVVGGLLALWDVIRRERDANQSSSPDSEADAGDASAHLHLDDAHPLAPDLDDVDTHAGHDHGVHGPRSAWLLLLPVAAIFLVAPPALGAFTAERQGSSVAQPADPAAPPLPPGDPVTVSLADYAARAVWDEGRTLQGRNVRMTGFVTPNPQGGWWLTRLQLSCCAADAIATKIKPLKVEQLPANTWVTVTGTWVPGGGTQSNSAVPLIDVASLKQVPEPKNPYE